VKQFKLPFGLVTYHLFQFAISIKNDISVSFAIYSVLF